MGDCMKASTAMTIDVKVLQQAKDNIPNISQFCENALAAHLNIIKKAEKDKIPREKIAEIQIVEQQERIAALEKEVKQLEKLVPKGRKAKLGEFKLWPPKMVVK